MKNCTQFPVRELSQPVFLAVSLVVPLLFGVSVVGNLLCLFALGKRCVRKLSPLFVYLTGSVCMDLFIVFSVAPGIVRDSELLPPKISYSWYLANVYYYTNGLRNTFLYAAIWMTSFMACARFVDITWPDNKFRCSQISASRIIAFVVFVFCGVINFPRYFEVAVVEVKGHCYEGTSLWHLERTFFARYHMYDYYSFYPWLTWNISYGFPFVLLLVALVLIVFKIGCRRLVHTKIACVTLKMQDDEDELQTSYLVIVLSLLMLVGELPNALMQLLSIANMNDVIGTQTARDLTELALCATLLRSSLTFPLCCTCSSNFRKALQRCFCCLCSADEYYEPVTCSSLCCPSSSSRHSNDDDIPVHHHVEHHFPRSSKADELIKLSRAESGDIWI